MSSSDPYRVLEVGRDASDAELRAAYRRAVQRSHPDHNGGSAESARRFEEVQEAYRVIREQRTSGASGSGRASGSARGSGTARGSGSAGASGTSRASSASGARPSTTSPDLDARLAAMEAELARAREVQERARRAMRDAAARATGRPRASDEELGYVTTDDSLGSIFSDAASRLSDHLSDARHPRDDSSSGSSGSGPGSSGSGAGSSSVADRMADVLEDVAARLRGERRSD